MHGLLLQFENGEDLDVRSFRVKEALSKPFFISVVARSANHDVNFETMIGRPVVFRVTNGAAFVSSPTRSWVGICTKCEQTRVERGGLSTYEVTIEPLLWMLSQRRNHRIFQHQSAPRIVETIFREWGIAHEAKLTDDAYPALEIRVQYGETDLAFVSRLLEEAGITFYFSERAGEMVVVLSDSPHTRDLRTAGAISFLDSPDEAKAAQVEYVTALRVRREVRPAKVVLRDFDFRHPRFELEASAAVGAGIEEKLEQYHYAPGRFVTEGHTGGETPAADDLGVARFHQPAGASLAARLLEAQRANRRGIAFETNAFDVAPGVTFSVNHHPRADLANTERLLATELEISGESDKEWVASGKAVFADLPYRPHEVTERPKIFGVQSAIVVGPKGDTVHTDEFGRVRVQFHWDRAQQHDPQSSCWVRVSQAWAGTGYGLVVLPRVGHEVLVGFVEGDPDHPVVVGRVFNGAQQVPYRLPGSKMMSAWKSDSNSNIILFDDTPHEEGFYEQAEKDRVGIVKENETYLTGGKRSTAIGEEQSTLVGKGISNFAVMEHGILAGKGVGSTAAYEWSGTGGIKADMKAGKEISIGVQPVVPFVNAVIDVLQAKAKLNDALPHGHPPDLAAVLPEHTRGSVVLKGPASASPLKFDKEQVEQGIEDLANLFGYALQGVTAQEIGEIFDSSNDIETAVATLLEKVKQLPVPANIVALAEMNALLAHLQALLDAIAAQDAEDAAHQAEAEAGKKKKEAASKAIDLLQKIITMILGKIVPTTSIKIEDQKIELKTKKAKIELTEDSIKLEADKDIEIKAKGKVSIEGESVSIEPSPCKCGGG